MPRRDRDPRPPIEVIGGASSEESVQDVEVGGSERGSGWWRLGLVAAVVGIGLVAVLGGGSDGDGERSASSSTTRSTVRRTTTSSTTTTMPAPLGPVLPNPTGASLLLLGQSGPFTLLDLDTGELTSVDRFATDVYANVLPVRGGVVVTDSVTAEYVPLLSGRKPVDLGEGGFILSSGRDDRVWVGSLQDPGSSRLPTSIRLVDLEGRVLARREFFDSGFYGATATGPVLSDGGRTYVVTDNGPRHLGIGHAVGTSATAVAIRECDHEGTCTPVLVDVASGDRRPLAALRGPAGVRSHADVRISPEGEILQVEFDHEGRPDVRWLDADGRLLVDGLLPLDDGDQGIGYVGDSVFLPDRQGTVWSTGSGSLIIARPTEGTIEIRRIPIPARVRAERVVVIRP